ncbi:TKL protein kinase [Phytophthora nicotianae P10297]|uniref:TKL protein kinase n=4 Tax=Phytophthora nicotianae TaxID=4792 RepID=W2Z6A5_PHYNI|nr:TKL protein kinase [Phytophthora nicotianae]ETM44558.1 TKL protein kinase [Phytophthora nicotianae]ETO73347.1 TKL protein kinase [Phytophthora nicotianae P1976]ETP42610.1 TKL protein kinase [Phytophthora nicotianae P10297]
MRLWWVWVATCALPLGLHAATTCPESGIAPPSEVTLAAAADGANDVAILVKNSDCDEVTIEATESEDPGSYRINASYVDIEVVESYPEVASLWLWNNKIKTFKAVGTSVTEVDITSNQLTSLDGLEFPSSVLLLTLDLNALTSTSASNFPDGLQRLYLRKNSITSLAKFRFSSELQNLYLNGNQQLTTLKGAVFPDSLQLIECSDCRITEIVGVTFPSKLKTMTLGGTTVTNFVVRESDVDVLKTAQLSLTVSLDEDDCSSVSGTVTTISSSVSACVLDDTSFSSLYPISNDSGSSGTSSSNSTTTSSSSTNGDSTTSSNNTNQASGGSGTNTVVINESSSSSSAGLIGGIVAGVVAVLLIIVGFIVYRRRQNKRRNSNADGFMALPTSKNPSGGLTAGSASQTLSLPPSSDGYLSNDVRNDEDLIPYRLPIEDIVIQEELASGGFGVVHLAHLYGQRVVVKQILPKAMSKDLLRRFMDEIRLYARMDHPKIVHFIGLAWTNLLDLSLVVEYMPRGDLTTLIRQKRLEKDGRRTFSWVGEDSQPRSKIEIALDMAEGLVYLHSFDPTIIHRDIKSRNVLLNHEWEAKLSDFGISREASESTMTGGMGTIAWIAPEVLQGERYSESADIFSLGITLSEMDTCGHPYNSHKSEVDALTDAKIALLVSTNAIKPTIEDDCPPEIRDVILKCVSFNASDRPTAVALHYQLRTIANTYQDMAMMQ